MIEAVQAGKYLVELSYDKEAKFGDIFMELGAQRQGRCGSHMDAWTRRPACARRRRQQQQQYCCLLSPFSTQHHFHQYGPVQYTDRPGIYRPMDMFMSQRCGLQAAYRIINSSHSVVHALIHSFNRAALRPTATGRRTPPTF